MKIDAIRPRSRSFPFAETRAIAHGVTSGADVLQVELEAAGLVGRGEASPSARYGESLAGMQADVERAADAILGLRSRADLAEVMSPGAARNAVDAALWDLEAGLIGQTAETIAGLAPTRPLTTAYTIPIKPPAEARQVAERERERPLIKVKLGHFDDDRARLEAIRAGAPDAMLIVDANEGWNLEQLAIMAPIARDLGVALIEQPIHRDRDAPLAGVDYGIPLCADESCHTRADLDAVANRYQFINIKLDKTGGLTEALGLAAAARRLGLGLMVGCTQGTTLALAPAFLIGQLCSFCDLDAPLFLAARESDELAYDGSRLDWSLTRKWGAQRSEHR